MARTYRIALSFSLLLTPRLRRAEKQEQWNADIRDCQELGIDPGDLVSGMIVSSIGLRWHHLVDEFSMQHKLNQERTMKFALSAAAIACLTLAGVTFSGNATETASSSIHEQTYVELASIPESWLGVDQPGDFILETLDPSNGLAVEN